MPLTTAKVPPFKTPKQNVTSWTSWKKGLNTLLRETEIDDAEVVQADNLLLVGSGVPTKRWGSANAFLAGATGYGRMIFPVKDNNDNIQVLALTDWGILVKQSGASYTSITGGSFASGYNVEAAEINANIYLTNGQTNWLRYDFNSLKTFPGLQPPTGITLTNFSGATGTTTWSWIVTAVGTGGGETTGLVRTSLATLPLFLNQTTVKVTWTATSAASGDLAGYNVYRGAPGSEIWVGGTPANTTSFFDNGTAQTQTFRIAPTTDSSAGPIAKYIIRYKDRLILAGLPNDPTRVLISAPWPLHQNFDTYSGGGFVLIEPGSGENITGLGSYFNAAAGIQTVVVFKEHSVWEVQINVITFGQYAILNPTYRLLTLSQGCLSHRSITPVENDLYFVNKRGMYILRYEPQLLNVINANELSAKIRPYFEGLTYSDVQNATGTYIDKKYVLSFPSAKTSIMYDRERLCFMGPWTTPFGINHWGHYIDAIGVEHWLEMDATDGYVSEFSKGYADDKGTPIRTVFKTKKSYQGDWTIYKTINEQYFNFRNVVGSLSVNIYLEQRNGATIVAKSLTITGNVSGKSGFGVDEFGSAEFGTSNVSPGITSTENPKKTFLFKTSRTIQIEIITTNSQDKYELLGLTTVALNQARGMSPSSWII